MTAPDERAAREALVWWEEYTITNECDPQEDFDWYVAKALVAHAATHARRLEEARAGLIELRHRLSGLGTFHRDITQLLARLSPPPPEGGR